MAAGCSALAVPFYVTYLFVGRTLLDNVIVATLAETFIGDQVP